MSILNAWITPHSALVGVDSEGVYEGRRFAVNKFGVLPAQNAIVACRGQSAFFASALSGAAMFPGDFDALLAGVPPLLPEVFAQVMGNAAAFGITDLSSMDRLELVIVGWSPNQGRVIGREFTQTSAGAGFVAGDIDPHYVAPWDQSMGPLPNPDSVTNMQRLARIQCAFLRERAPEMAGGGKLILAEVTQHYVKVSHMAELVEAPNAGICGWRAHG